jgi:AcrR family transcriptional regulator
MSEGHQPRLSQRDGQRERTRASLIESARSLIRSGSEITMPVIAHAAGVSEATAYRYFPDLLSIMEVGFVGVWPDAHDIVPSIEICSDPVERIGIAADFLARNVLKIQGAVRTMISLTIARPDLATVRPAHRMGLIETALEPLAGLNSDRLDQLRNDLSIVVSAEALFTLLDLKNLAPEVAIASLTETAKNLVRVANRDLELTDSRHSRVAE